MSNNKDHLVGQLTNVQVTRETTVLEGWLRGGRLHGPARRTEMKKFRTFRQQVGLQ